MRKTILLACCLLLCGCTAKQTAVPVSQTVSVLSNAVSGWGYRPMGDARPEFTAEQIAMMKKYDCIYMGADDKNLYLTFDEGYENGHTAAILDTLKAMNVPAAFFVTAPYIQSNEALVQRMVTEGHTVGNHTVHHPSMPSITNDKALEEELLGVEKLYFDISGQKMQFLRPPMGEYSERTLALSKKLGYTNVFWSFAYKDWDTKAQQGADYALQKVTKGLHGGCVLLLHAVSKDNADALPSIITTAQSMGYTFQPLSAYIPNI